MQRFEVLDARPQYIGIVKQKQKQICHQLLLSPESMYILRLRLARLLLSLSAEGQDANVLFLVYIGKRLLPDFQVSL